MSTRALCIHAHFYQPAREDPTTNLIPSEHGAGPYRNWNEKILHECYRPNAELGNFERISFNIGPTLLSWLQGADPVTSRSIIAQDQANLRRFGVGNAIAQSYHHTILPLANHHDKETQVAWGIADFKHKFGHAPQGMWLPETAADIETLTVLAEHGIEFTILAPWQADSPNIDPTEPYRVNLPGGLAITVFFYHQDLSAGVSFIPSLTTNADLFAQQEVVSRFNRDKNQSGDAQLLLIASDGELYGHHQQFRDRFLAHLVNGASAHAGLDITYPGRWLIHHPPKRSQSIIDGTSWSCRHGVQRWMGECDCIPGDGRWKSYLRQGFNRLAGALDTLYYDKVQGMGIDPWDLRNQYINVILGEIRLDELAGHLAGKHVDEERLRTLHFLLEAQRERQRMFTSCGWFFEDFGRIEPLNNVAYAAQAVYLMRQATGLDLSTHIMADLRYVKSQLTGLRGDIVFLNCLQKAERNTSKN
jgi:hypothetical protein